MVREEKATRASEKAARHLKRKRKSTNPGSVSYPGSLADDNKSEAADSKKRTKSLAAGRAPSLNMTNDRRHSIAEEEISSLDNTPATPASPGRYLPRSPRSMVPRTYSPNGPTGMDGMSSRRSNKNTMQLPPRDPSLEEPLKGLRVIIIHVKDTLKDGPHISVSILEQLKGHAAALAENGNALGCEFVISESGKDYWF